MTMKTASKADAPVSNIVSRSDAVPLYHQIFLALRDQIMHGQLTFGSPVPTELELVAHHGVSRITARRALHELAASGLVERKRRVGTRVVYRTSAVPLEANVDQAVESLIAFGRNTPVKVLDIVEEVAPRLVADALERPADSMMLRGRRIRHLDRQPLGLVTSWVPVDLGVKMTKEGLTKQPILDLLREAGFVPGSGRQTISARHADPETAALLKLEPRAALLRVERVVADMKGAAVLYTIADYRADRYRLSLDLHGVTKPQVG
jgi:GntR family transcriptional regulator